MTNAPFNTVSGIDSPSISVVVIGRNEGERLVHCLESIRASDYPSEKIELIYVDSDSTDSSCQVAESCGAQVIRLDSDHPCAAAARNAGLRRAQHELIHFLDGDTVLNPTWFGKAVAAMQESKIACVFGRREEAAPTATLYNFWTHHDWHVDPGPANHCAGDALFRRDVLLDQGGYDESLIAGEEPDLCFRIRDRLGMVILRLDEPMTLHDIDMKRFSQYWRRCFRTGHAYAEVSHRQPGFFVWRRKCQRNIVHAMVAIFVIVMSIAQLSPWPIVVWMGLMCMLLIRNALRYRSQVGSMAGAFLYSMNHYIAKVPILAGQCDYWLRRWLARKPRTLIEYRSR